MQPVVRVIDAEAALFASDMHLDDEHPALTDRFLSALDQGLTPALARANAGDHPVDKAQADAARPALFLLGDLFEYWIGDDFVTPAASALATRLAAYAAAGVRIYLMHGNRDFLLDVPLPSSRQTPGLSTPSYSARCGATFLDDPSLIEVGGQRIALSHGDALCTDDSRYQQWRALCRSETWQQDFLGHSIAQRQAMALDVRKQSLQAQATTETLSDVDQDAVEQLMDRLGTDLLIHGHTHRPLLHHWRAAEGGAVRQRWVLSDWAAVPPRGEVLSAATVAVGY